MIALMFPGQGSQTVGMGQSLSETWPAAKAVFDEVDEALGENLSALMFGGDPQQLQRTENTQPALLATSVACVAALIQEADLNPQRQLPWTALAGHSVGEYAALVVAGVLSLADAAQLVRARGLAMQRAVPQANGAMVAILGLDLAAVQDITKKIQSDTLVCTIANDNCPGQVVISGDRDAVLRAAEVARERGARRAIALPVSAPFHCPLMEPAAKVMQEKLAPIAFSQPRISVYANVTAKPIAKNADIKKLLIQQITAPVRWRETLENLIKENPANTGAQIFFEMGAGQVLTGLLKRVDRQAKGLSLEHADGVRAAAQILRDIA